MNTDTTTIKPGWTGRADYAERCEARIERLQDAAERHDEAALSALYSFMSERMTGGFVRVADKIRHD